MLPTVSVTDAVSPEDLDPYVIGRLSQSHSLHEPKSIIALFGVCCSLVPPASISYIVFKSIDRIVALTHRNQALMNEAGLMTPLFNLLYRVPSHNVALAEVTRHLLRKTFRRLLDIGFCSAQEERDFFQEMLQGTKVNSEVLAILKSGGRSKWPEFLSFHRSAALIFNDESGKTFPPPSGFTFSVSTRCHK